MVISFSNDDVFSFLEQYGYVATFRSSRRKRPNCKTWCNRGRGQEKEFDVRIVEIGEVRPFDAGTNMVDFEIASGLGGLENWRDAIREFHGEVKSGWLYIVVKDD